MNVFLVTLTSRLVVVLLASAPSMLCQMNVIDRASVHAPVGLEV